MQHEFQIRSLSGDDLCAPFKWAAQLGWNPGIEDQTAFVQTDPQGFMGGYLGNRLIATLSAVRYDDSFGFLGFYIVDPVYRAKGYGLKVWQAGLKRLQGVASIGLDGVVSQQDNYMKSGFVLAYNNYRFALKPSNAAQTFQSMPALSNRVKIINAQTLSPQRLSDLYAFDREHFPTQRDSFIRQWIASPSHHCVVAVQEGDVRGYGVIRPCLSGYKVGPLLAQTSEIAYNVFAALLQTVQTDQTVYLDCPHANPDAIKMAQSLGMDVVFKTARMYKGIIPSLPIDHLYGVTSFELG